MEDGDIVNLDCTVYTNGFHGDTSRTFLVGDVDESGKTLVEVLFFVRLSFLSTCSFRLHESALKLQFLFVARVWHFPPLVRPAKPYATPWVMA